MIIREQTNKIRHAFFILQRLIKKKKTIPSLFNVSTSCYYQKHLTAQNKLIFFNRFVAMLFLSYKLITNKISIE